MRTKRPIGMRSILSPAVALLAAIAAHSPAQAAITIDMVTVGNAGNAADTRYDTGGFGSVGYNYQIGKYEVTAAQYTEFLNAVAKDDPNGLYTSTMGDGDAYPGAGIQRGGSSPNYSYSVTADRANRPVSRVNFWNAARCANWLHNGQPTGAEGPGTTEDGAYHDVGNQALFGRNAGAQFFIPTEDEWYKAAYHDKSAGLAATYFDFPTGTNAWPGNDITETTNPGNNANFYLGDRAIGAPYYHTVVGEFELSDSPYGTFDQAGNVWEWNETTVLGGSRGTRGGSHNDYLQSTMHAQTRWADELPPEWDLGYYEVGFRVAGIPEPASITLCFAGLLILVPRRGRK